MIFVYPFCPINCHDNPRACWSEGFSAAAWGGGGAYGHLLYGFGSEQWAVIMICWVWLRCGEVMTSLSGELIHDTDHVGPWLEVFHGRPRGWGSPPHPPPPHGLLCFWLALPGDGGEQRASECIGNLSDYRRPRANGEAASRYAQLGFRVDWSTCPTSHWPHLWPYLYLDFSHTVLAEASSGGEALSSCGILNSWMLIHTVRL